MTRRKNYTNVAVVENGDVKPEADPAAVKKVRLSDTMTDAEIEALVRAKHAEHKKAAES